MKLLLLIVAYWILAACGSQDHSQTKDRVDPSELRGKLTVLGPDDITLPDCSSSYSGYNNSRFRAKTNGLMVAEGVVGRSIQIPEGKYHVIINETFVPVQIKRREETTIRLGRAEVSDVGGTWVIMGQNITGHSRALSTLKTGCGVNLAPAHYMLRVSFQSHTADYQVDLTD